MREIRAIIIQPQDFVYPPAAKDAINAHWLLCRDWIQFKAGVKLRWLPSPTWLVAPWDYNSVASEVIRPGGNLPEKVFGWLNSDPTLPPALWSRGTVAAESQDAWCVMVLGAGGWSGSSQKGTGENISWAMVGSAVLGPILRASGLPTLDDCGNFFPAGAWQCEYGTAVGTIIHETSHAAFAVDHGTEAENQQNSSHVMRAHWEVNPNDFSASGYLPRHLEQIRASNYLATEETGGGISALLTILALVVAGLVLRR